jgi:hypothetical protein
VFYSLETPPIKHYPEDGRGNGRDHAAMQHATADMRTSANDDSLRTFVLGV